MNYLFSKDKLPKGMSYPLKRSAFDAALQEANVRDLCLVDYLRRQRTNEVIRPFITATTEGTTLLLVRPL